MPFLIAFLLVITGIEAFRALTRRQLVRRWAEEQGWTVRRLRYRFRPFRWTWEIHYWLEAVDSRGQEHSGLVHSSGFLTREVAWTRRGEP